jgi:hypothetical protein
VTLELSKCLTLKVICSIQQVTSIPLLEINDAFTEFNKMHAEERDWLKSEIAKAKENKEPVLVLTHHSPVKDCGCSDPQYFGGVSQAAFCTDLRSMLGAPVDVWAYGHTHCKSYLLHKHSIS